MLRAILFDCNGIIADDEGVHYLLFRNILAQEGIDLTREEYDRRYLSYDDRHCFEAVLRDGGHKADPARIQDLMQRKARAYRGAVGKSLKIFPGVKELVHAAVEYYALAVASGARREEIAYILNEAGLFTCFQAVVGAEDVQNAKPHPEPFLTALDRLNAVLCQPDDPISPPQCLVIEDSMGGIQGARAAGMRCLAVTNTYPATALQGADRVVGSLEEVTPESLASLFPGNSRAPR
ncbi:MAG: HAD family phosphatase [Acidobacteriota bacterium]